MKILFIEEIILKIPSGEGNATEFCLVIWAKRRSSRLHGKAMVSSLFA